MSDELSELEHLRSIYRTLQYLETNLQNIRSSLQKGELEKAGHHLAIAQQHLLSAKKEIALVGQQKADPQK